MIGISINLWDTLTVFLKFKKTKLFHEKGASIGFFLIYITTILKKIESAFCKFIKKTVVK